MHPDMASLQVAGLHLRSGDREVTEAASLSRLYYACGRGKGLLRVYPVPSLINQLPCYTPRTHTLPDDLSWEQRTLYYAC